MSDTRPLVFDFKAFASSAPGGGVRLPCTEHQVIFSQGDPADSVAYIEDGKVKISVVSEQGKEAVIALLGRGDFFGESCLVGQRYRRVSATAMTAATVVSFEKTAMMRLIHERPEIAGTFIDYILSRSMRTEEDLIDHLFNSSEKRLARILLILANFGKDGRPEAVIAKISQETLAEMVGTTRSRISHFMNKFRKLGYIDYDGQIEVHSSLLNVVLYDQPDDGRAS